MIICEYSELKKYESILPMLEHALACVEELRGNGFPTGRHEYEGGFLFVQRGTTQPFSADLYEAHRKYIDIQYMIEGGETAYYAPINGLEVNKEYDEEKEVIFFTKHGAKGTPMQITPGMCWVAYPEDAHMPCRCGEESNDYLKIVMKLPLA